MKDLGIAYCVKESEKSFQFHRLGTSEQPFWVPKKAISMGDWKVGFQGSLVVEEWWTQMLQSGREPGSGPSPHQRGLCKMCLKPYEEHPPVKGKRWFDKAYLVLCDGCVWNTEIKQKTSRMNYHSESWWEEVQEARHKMGCWNGSNSWEEHRESCTNIRCRGKN